MTPFERVIASKQGDQVKIAELEKLYKTLNPFDLARTIENKLEAILKLANRRQSPKVTAVQKTEQKEKRPLTKVEKETFERLSNIFPGLIIHAKDSKQEKKKA